MNQGTRAGKLEWIVVLVVALVAGAGLLQAACSSEDCGFRQQCDD